MIPTGKRLTIGLGFHEDESILNVYEFAKNNRIVKVIDANTFTKLSDPAEFSRMLQHLWAVDEVQFTAPYTPMTSLASPPVAYTVPRTGTHVVTEVHHLHKFVHAEPWPKVDSPLLTDLLAAKYIAGVARKNFIDFVCSREILKITPGGVMLTNKSKLASNTLLAKSLVPVAVDLSRVQDYLQEMANYYNQLMALKIMFSKHVSFCLLDDLAVRKDLLMIKNPYQHEELIINYQELQELVNAQFQPAYEYMTNQVISYCGLALSGVQYPSVNNFS